jgi:peptide deformylase
MIDKELFQDLQPYDIVLAPDPVLKQTSNAVEEVNDDIRTQALRMLKTMYSGRGIGLAANQVGIANRVIVVDVEQTRPGNEDNDESNDGDNDEPKNGKPYVMINPEITFFSKEMSSYQEGCLSIPAQYAEVERPENIEVSFLDLDGKQQSLKADGLFAVAIQHEIDHIDGILFTDHLSRLKRSSLLRKLEKYKKLCGYDNNRVPLST